LWKTLAMPAEQASNTGCNFQNLAEGWVSRSTLEDSLKISLFFLERKRELSSNLKCQQFSQDYLEQPCIPEIFALNFCSLNGREDIKEQVALLEAFQTYAVSLYDQIDDNHLFRNGEKTLLGVCGLKKAQKVKLFCERIYSELARGLEAKVPNASSVANEQYLLTLKADTLRNQTRILSPKEAMDLQNLLAGIPTEKIALLCGGNSELIALARNLGNSLSTMDDLIDLINLEDIGKRKTTIPLAYLKHFNITGDSREETRANFLRSEAFYKTSEYILAELSGAQRILKYLGSPGESLLNKYVSEMTSYLKRLEDAK
jgi:hypothetical protein